MADYNLNYLLTASKPIHCKFPPPQKKKKKKKSRKQKAKNEKKLPNMNVT